MATSKQRPIGRSSGRFIKQIVGSERKKRGGFCRPPRQLYPQEERGIQRAKYRGSEGGWQRAIPHSVANKKAHKAQKLLNYFEPILIGGLNCSSKGLKVLFVQWK